MDILMNITIVLSNYLIHILELIGILIIGLGSLQSLIMFVKSGFDFDNTDTRINLGESLSLALQFKLGAEIIKTVIIHNMDEVIILAIVVVIRIALSVLIHWEIEEAAKIEH